MTQKKKKKKKEWGWNLNDKKINMSEIKKAYQIWRERKEMEKYDHRH